MACEEIVRMLLINILVIRIHVCPWELGGIIFAEGQLRRPNAQGWSME
jgi:hypothetical protein